MKISLSSVWIWLLCFGGLLPLVPPALAASATGEVEVLLQRTPDGGIQPQAAVDGRGTMHLIYYRGESGKGDIFYTRQLATGSAFEKAIRVNRKAGSAIAAGTIRGAQLAIGRAGRVHVAWNGPAPEKGAWMKAPMLYARLDDSGTAFEAERDVITRARGLDGG